MAINNLIDNQTFKDLKEPVALFFSYVDADKYDYLQSHPQDLISLKSHCKEQLVTYLIRNNYPAVTDDSILAAHPGTIVISQSGIQTPFLPPKKAREFIVPLLNAVNNSGFARPMSMVVAVRLEQLAPPVLYPQREPDVFNYLRHPNGRLHDYIKYRYSGNFVERMYRRAWSLGEDTSALLKQIPEPQNLSQDLFSGRQLIVEPFYIHARNDSEARYIVYATPDYANAARYCGYKKGERKHGFIHHFGKYAYQLYYEDFGMERGGKPQFEPGKQIETLVVPGQNPFRGSEIYMGTRRFEIPDNDEEWEVFREYHRAAYIPNNDNLAQRRTNILMEAKENGGNAVCYLPIGSDLEELSLERYQSQAMGIEEQLAPPPKQIRKTYYDFLTKIDHLAQIVRSLKQPRTQPEKQASSNPAQSHTASPKHNKSQFEK